MDAKDEIRKALQKILGENFILGDNSFVIGNVIEGSVSGNYCDVQPLEGATIKKVRLNAYNEKAGVTVTPKDGSFVIVAMLSNTDAFVAMFSEMQRVEMWFNNEKTTMSIEDGTVKYKDGKNLEITVSGGKLEMRNGGVSLKEQLDKLLTALTTAVIATPAGTGAFATNTVQSITEVKTNINKLLC